MNDLVNSNIISEIKELLHLARERVAVSVNTELLSTYWHIGEIIVKYEQKDSERAEYGKQTLKEISKALTEEFGRG